jgi:hypothetical protein
MSSGDGHSILAGVVTVAELLAYAAADCYFTRRQAARYCAMSLRKLDRCRVERYRVGGMVYYRKSRLDAFMVAHREQQTPGAELGSLRSLIADAKRKALKGEKAGIAGGRR